MNCRKPGRLAFSENAREKEFESEFVPLLMG